MDLTDLKEKTLDDLGALAADLGIVDSREMKRSDLVLAIMRVEARAGSVRGSGVLEVLSDGFGFLRGPESNLTPGPDDIYVSPSQIRRFHLRTGDAVGGVVRPPKESERYYALLKVETINGLGPEERKKKLFDNLTAVYPSEPLALEHDPKDKITRLIDLFAPLGKGQRVLLSSPPRAGKSALLRSIAKAVSTNHKDVTLLILLVGERPEEITDMQRAGVGEVIASSLDDTASRHVQVAELALEKAKRVAEKGGDAVLVVDSMSRLARAYAATHAATHGGTHAGTHAGTSAAGSRAQGVDPAVIHQCRRFFGTARKLEEGGSLTIVAAANSDSSRPLEATVAAELSEAASTLVALDPELLDQRVKPPFDLRRSESRDAERVVDEDFLTACSRLRRKLLKEDKADAIDRLIDLFSEHADNASLVTNHK